MASTGAGLRVMVWCPRLRAVPDALRCKSRPASVWCPDAVLLLVEVVVPSRHPHGRVLLKEIVQI